MRVLITSAAMAAAIAFTAAADAQAWERKTMFEGLRGASSAHATGSCSNRSCARDVSRTGAAGRTFTRSGQRNCQGGACSGARVTTGPNGRTSTRETTITR
ncbi:MAG: hypothetical protein AAFN79_22015 [Pseudomonadota bacterium]